MQRFNRLLVAESSNVRRVAVSLDEWKTILAFVKIWPYL